MRHQVLSEEAIVNSEFSFKATFRGISSMNLLSILRNTEASFDGIAILTLAAGGVGAARPGCRHLDHNRPGRGIL
jgi:hypothetical protein